MTSEWRLKIAEEVLINKLRDELDLPEDQARYMASFVTRAVIEKYEDPVPLPECPNDVDYDGLCLTCAHHRAKAYEEAGADFADRIYATGMVLCPDCGNKRCPKATYHGHDCTKSNEPGQIGSAYGVLPCDDPECPC